MDNPQDKINALLSDPENLKTLAKIASGFMAQSPMPAAEQASTSTDASAQPSDADSASAQSTEDGQAAQTSADGKDAKDDNAAPKFSGQISPDSGLLSGLLGSGFKIPGDVDKSIVLLNALKPYLGNHKREICELIVKLLGAAKLLGMYKVG